MKGKLKEEVRGRIEFDAVLDYLPINMLIEVTNACNHECIFCAHKKMKRPIGQINEAFCKRILKEAYAGGTRKVGFYMTGEPLVCNQLVEYVRCAKECGYTYIYLTTNGALADLERMNPIIEAGLDSIKFSVNAGIRETYAAVHGRDDFDIVIRNLKALSAFIRKNQYPVKIFVTYILCRQNQNEFEKLKDLIGADVDNVTSAPAYNQGGNVYEIKNGTMLDPDYKPVIAPCGIIFNRLHVTYEGYLNACCVDFENNLKVADLNTTDLMSAWNSETMQYLRKMHIQKAVDRKCMCYNCIHNTDHDVISIEKLCGGIDRTRNIQA